MPFHAQFELQIHRGETIQIEGEYQEETYYESFGGPEKTRQQFAVDTIERIDT